jgi:pimeloyl-ACP methyl ester carboxylesterase
MQILFVAGLTFIGFVTVLYLLQTRMIFPGASTQGQPFAVITPPPGTELLRLRTDDGESIAALFGPALRDDGRSDPDAPERPSMIYFYGNAMCLNYATLEFDRFRRLGLNVLLPEYVGYGMSSGSPSERGCRSTALAAYDYLLSKRGASPERIITAGWSLGGAVAIDLASRRHVGGLIVFSTFTSGVDMGRRVMPFAPVSLLLRHRFDNLKKLPTIRCPILISHGRQDQIVPFEMGERLAAAAAGPVTTLWIDEADHNDFFDVAGRRVDEAVVRFLKDHFDSR